MYPLFSIRISLNVMVTPPLCLTLDSVNNCRSQDWPGGRKTEFGKFARCYSPQPSAPQNCPTDNQPLDL
jgi:hypothetical protein